MLIWLTRRPVTQVSPETRQRLIYSLDSWNFEPHKLPEDEGLAAALILFEALFHMEGMEEDIGCTTGASPHSSSLELL
jgi:hypothetical protein